MAQFNSTVITNRGQALLAKVEAGQTALIFTKIKTSSNQYSVGTDLAALNDLTSIKQTQLVSGVSYVSPASVLVSAAFTNAELGTGYYIYAVGLYATDPQLGEILFSVTTASTADFMPANNGVSVSSILTELLITTGNATNVNLTVDPAAVATNADIQRVDARITNLEGYVGYSESDIYGVEWDVPNKTITRLSGSKNPIPGVNFDNLTPWKRRRCILNDAGVVLAYYGDAAYTETGKLTQAVTVNETTYPVGTICQVMVEQPLFYYRTTPIDFKKIEGQRGLSAKKIRYYVSGFPHVGFKPHPQFVRNGKVLSKIYKGAFEACAYDVSASAYILTDEQIADFTATTGDKLSSIAGVKPLSGKTQNATRNGLRTLAKNRGEGWGQEDFISSSGTQLLFLIEYASFDSQGRIGQGVTNKPDVPADDNNSENTGATSFLGNASGMAPGTNGLVSITYRGEENFWGNIWKWEDGLNVQNKSATDYGYAFFNQPDWRTTYPVDNTEADYKNVGFQIAQASGYASAIGWSEDCDFAFLATETAGASNIPMNDYFGVNKDSVSWFVSYLSGLWTHGLTAGAFSRNVADNSGNRHRTIGGRVLFVPAA
mgnify:FL=1